MLRIPFDRLPDDNAARHGALRTYFCDKDATVARESDGWHLSLHWPDDAERHVDLRLHEGLSWWGDGVHLGTMWQAQRRSGRILTSLFDTWTLHSWSEWLARRSTRDGADALILHVDDHRDVMSPRVFMNADGLQDAIQLAPFDFADPQTVRLAIESGAVGMGSFMTPYLHCAPASEVRHLWQPPKTTSTTDHVINRVRIPDTLIQPGTDRLGIELAQTTTGAGPGRYRVTNSVADWLAGIQLRPALLHIDMDYFNNRYDGDSGWDEQTGRLDPSIDDVFLKIDEMVGALEASGIARHIEDVVIAFSPGFFPAELWEPADTRLRAALEAIIGR